MICVLRVEIECALDMLLTSPVHARSSKTPYSRNVGKGNILSEGGRATYSQ